MNPNHPISEQFRLVAKEWVELDGAARLLEESKTATLALKKSELGDMPESKAEKLVKSSEEWRDYIEKMTIARTNANKKKVQLEYIKMKFWEWQSEGANRRSEMKL